MDRVQPSDNLVSRNGEENTELKQGDPGEQTAKLECHKSDEISVNGDVNRMNIKGDHCHPSNDLASRKGDEIKMKQGEQTTELQSHENDYESEFISFMVSRNKDEITKVKQGDTSEQTAKLQSQQSDEYVKAEASKNLVSSCGDETDIKQGDPGEQIAELQSHTNDESVNTEEDGKSEENLDHIRFWPLLKAVLENDWKGVEDFITEDPKVLTTRIKICQEETIFHILARKLDTPSWLMEKLTSMIAPESLQELTDCKGRLVLYRAAMFGNRKAAEAFVCRNNDLPNINDSNGYLPIHVAALYGHKETTQYLLSVTRVPLDDDRGFDLVRVLLESGLYGIALNLLKLYPQLARDKEDRGNIIKLLASKPQAFESGSRLGYWKRIIYHWIPVQEEYIPQPGYVDGDVENPIVQRSNKLKNFRHFGSIFRQISAAFGALCQKLHIMLWNALVHLVPSIKCIRDTKLIHTQTLQIVRIMCHEGVIWSHEEAMDSFWMQILAAASMGICELVHEILKAYFYSYAFIDKEDGDGIFPLAVLNRQEKVFSLVKKMNLCLSNWKGSSGVEKADNILHLAGRVVPSSQVTGAALQMQRELQWFKAVESYVHPSLQEQRNNSNKTPREVFTEEHKDLVKEGEKWMKDTASSCTVVAALIITVVFAAGFTVPGGNNSGGMPNFLHEPPFIVFVISDALALFSSTTSLLMFLGILTSRYAEQDFLKSLPKKLIFGLITLFFSIASMMVAFGSTVYIFLSQPWKWTIIPISLLGCFPVTLFALLQFPLLVEIFLSTYRPRITSW